MKFFPFRPVSRHILLVSAFFIASVSPLRAETPVLQEARTALESLAEKHRKAATVSLAFESRALGADGNPMPPVKGTLVTADSGRFRLRHAQGIVISDGVTVWQHFPSTKQVVIRSASEPGGTAGAGGILMRFLQARAVKAQRVGGALRITLDPASVGESLDSLVLTLSPDGSAVRRVETEDPAGNRVEYILTSLRYDARPGRAAFTFKVPDGTETVDMR